MPQSEPISQTDPTPIFELFRGCHATELLTIAVAHFDLFGRLANTARSAEDLRAELGLAERPFLVLTTALRAMGLLHVDESGRMTNTELAANHLVPGAPLEITGYIGLAARQLGVVEMLERLKSNRPAGAADSERGAAFIFREGIESAMERESSARALTLSLAGRARNVAPWLVRAFPLPEARLLLDIAGGSGLYAIEYLKAFSELRAIVWDRPEVLRVAAEFADAAGVAERLEYLSGDMFIDEVPLGADVMLLSNVLHDWDVAECRALLARAGEALAPRGSILIHDVFLDDDLGGPLAVALYSAALFQLTEGRAYGAREYREWLRDAGFESGSIAPTLVHCGVLPAWRAGEQ